MRWVDKEHKQTRRFRRKFLLLPRSFNGVTRWLEFALSEERYQETYDFEIGLGPCACYAWCEVGFADERTENDAG